MKILFIHKNYPAQFGKLAEWLVKQGIDARFASMRKAQSSVPFVAFEAQRGVTEGIHPYVAGLESAVINGQAFAQIAVALRSRGYQPDIVVAHAGWGVGMLAKDVWPDCKYVPYFEWYYTWPAIDSSAHNVPRDDLQERFRTRIRNSPIWLEFSDAEIGICPTQFQADRFPTLLRNSLKIMPDGVDTALHSPGPKNRELLEKLGIPLDAPIVSFLARGMDPMRGFPEMMTAVAELQKTHPSMHTIIVGEDRIAYGPKDHEKSWKQRMLEKLDIDVSRLHFTGLVSRQVMVDIFRCSWVHLYLSAPFVLSWSFLEAMSSGCLIVAMRTPAVEDFMVDQKTGILVPPNNHDALVGAVSDALDKQFADKSSMDAIRRAARQHIVETCDAEAIAYPQKLALFRSMLKACD